MNNNGHFSDFSYERYRCPECDYEGKISCPDHSVKKEKRYFIELIIKDSDTLEPIQTVSTSSDYPESLFVAPVHYNISREISRCLDILIKARWLKKKYE
jgi:hypothetical protein